MGTAVTVGAGLGGVAVSAAGAVAVNKILTDTQAYIQNGVVDSLGSIAIDADNSATIDATIKAISAAAAIGLAADAGAVGVASAYNLLGYNQSRT